MTTSFIFSYPDFSKVVRISWYPEALTFAVIVSFTDGATAKGSLSGSDFQVLIEKARVAKIPLVELCAYCKENPGNHRWTFDGDVITICKDCAEVEEF
jgi:hypothetical protein